MAGSSNGAGDVVRAHRPRHELWISKIVDAERPGTIGFRLLRVGADDLQVRSASQVDEMVAGAHPHVLAAGNSLDAQSDGGHVERFVEVGPAVDEMVDVHQGESRRQWFAELLAGTPVPWLGMRLGVLAIGVLAAACAAGASSPTSTPTSSTTSTSTTVPATTTTSEAVPPDISVPPGHRGFGSAGEGFVLALPDSFVAADLDGDESGTIAGNIDAIAPSSAEAIRNLVVQRGDELLFVAVDSADTEDDFLTSVNILVIPTPGTTADAVLASLEQTYLRRDGRVEESRRFQVGPSEWLVTTASAPLALPDGGEITQTVYGLYAISPNAVINVSLSTDDGPAYADAFEVLVDSFRLGVVPGLSA